MAWYDNAIIFYDWIRYGEDLDTSYAEFLVKKAKDIRANTLAFCSCKGWSKIAAGGGSNPSVGFEIRTFRFVVNVAPSATPFTIHNSHLPHLSRHKATPLGLWLFFFSCLRSAIFHIITVGGGRDEDVKAYNQSGKQRPTADRAFKNL